MEILFRSAVNIASVPKYAVLAAVIFSAALLIQIFICSKTRRILSRLFAIIITGFAITLSYLVFTGILELQNFTPDAAAEFGLNVCTAAFPAATGFILGYIIYAAASLIVNRRMAK